MADAADVSQHFKVLVQALNEHKIEMSHVTAASKDVVKQLKAWLAINTPAKPTQQGTSQTSSSSEVVWKLDSNWSEELSKISQIDIKTGWVGDLLKINELKIDTSWISDLSVLNSIKINTDWVDELNSINSIKIDTSWISDLSVLNSIKINTDWVDELSSINSIKIDTSWISDLESINNITINTRWLSDLSVLNDIKIDTGWLQDLTAINSIKINTDWITDLSAINEIMIDTSWISKLSDLKLSLTGLSNITPVTTVLSGWAGELSGFSKVLQDTFTNTNWQSIQSGISGTSGLVPLLKAVSILPSVQNKSTKGVVEWTKYLNSIVKIIDKLSDIDDSFGKKIDSTKIKTIMESVDKSIVEISKGFIEIIKSISISESDIKGLADKTKLIGSALSVMSDLLKIIGNKKALDILQTLDPTAFNSTKLKEVFESITNFFISSKTSMDQIMKDNKTSQDQLQQFIRFMREMLSSYAAIFETLNMGLKDTIKTSINAFFIGLGWFDKIFGKAMNAIVKSFANALTQIDMATEEIKLLSESSKLIANITNSFKQILDGLAMDSIVKTSLKIVKSWLAFEMLWKPLGFIMGRIFRNIKKIVDKITSGLGNVEEFKEKIENLREIMDSLGKTMAGFFVGFGKAIRSKDSVIGMIGLAAATALLTFVAPALALVGPLLWVASLGINTATGTALGGFFTAFGGAFANPYAWIALGALAVIGIILIEFAAALLVLGAAVLVISMADPAKLAINLGIIAVASFAFAPIAALGLVMGPGMVLLAAGFVALGLALALITTLDFSNLIDPIVKVIDLIQNLDINKIMINSAGLALSVMMFAPLALIGIPLGYGLVGAALGISALALSFKLMLTMGLEKVSESFVSIMSSLIEFGKNGFRTAFALGAVTVSLAAFFTVVAAASAGSTVGRWLGANNPLTPIVELADKSEELSSVAASLYSIADSIDRISNADLSGLTPLTQQLGEVSLQAGIQKNSGNGSAGAGSVTSVVNQVANNQKTELLGGRASRSDPDYIYDQLRAMNFSSI